MLIDFHTHAYHPKIANTAVKNLAFAAGNITPMTDGTVEGLRRHTLEECGADMAVILHIATNPAQMQKTNDFAAAVSGDGIVCFGSVHPDAPDALEELSRIKELGLPGVKFHPDYQHFYVDEPRMFPIYERIAELGLMTTFHSGVDIEFFDPVHCTPERLSKALPYFQGATVIAAHMGGFEMYNDVEKYLVGKNVYFDTAVCGGILPRGQAKRIIEAHGADRVLFGSDMPWSSTKTQAKYIDCIEISDEDKEKIKYRNALRLLGMQE